MWPTVWALTHSSSHCLTERSPNPPAGTTAAPGEPGKLFLKAHTPLGKANPNHPPTLSKGARAEHPPRARFRHSSSSNHLLGSEPPSCSETTTGRRSTWHRRAHGPGLLTWEVRLLHSRGSSLLTHILSVLKFLSTYRKNMLSTDDQVPQIVICF